MKLHLLAALGLGAAVLGCAGSTERAVRHDLTQMPVAYAGMAAEADPKNDGDPQPVGPRAGVEDYVRLALDRSPTLRADFERWKASVHRVSGARRLPDPTLSFGYYIRSVETRVGPQQARIGLQQAFPWPTRLTAGADAASAQARAMQRRFEAQALTVARSAAGAYWDLWQVRATRTIEREHLDVVRGLSDSVRGRVATGAATLAELQQTDLTAARIEDRVRGMDERERSAEARLRAVLGVDSTFAVPTFQGPGPAAMPQASTAELRADVEAHPRIEGLGLLTQASEATARAEGAERLPSFTVGADWVVTGDAVDPSVEGSGRDAVVVGAGVRIPLWQASYSDGVAAARAESRAREAERRSALDQAQAALTSTLADLRDATRRIGLYRSTLVPQAESAYESVLGAYTVGRASVSQALISQRDLLELRTELERARADHARTWAKLEELVGRELTPARPGEGGTDG